MVNVILQSVNRLSVLIPSEKHLEPSLIFTGKAAGQHLLQTVVRDDALCPYAEIKYARVFFCFKVVRFRHFTRAGTLTYKCRSAWNG